MWGEREEDAGWTMQVMDDDDDETGGQSEGQH
jgi:hypothetical protein